MKRGRETYTIGYVRVKNREQREMGTDDRIPTFQCPVAPLRPVHGVLIALSILSTVASHLLPRLHLQPPYLITSSYGNQL